MYHLRRISSYFIPTIELCAVKMTAFPSLILFKHRRDYISLLDVHKLSWSLGWAVPVEQDGSQPHQIGRRPPDQAVHRPVVVTHSTLKDIAGVYVLYNIPAIASEGPLAEDTLLFFILRYYLTPPANVPAASLPTLSRLTPTLTSILSATWLAIDGVRSDHNSRLETTLIRVQYILDSLVLRHCALWQRLFRARDTYYLRIHIGITHND